MNYEWLSEGTDDDESRKWVFTYLFSRTFCRTASLLRRPWSAHSFYSFFTTQWHFDQILTRHVSKDCVPPLHQTPLPPFPVWSPHVLCCVITGALQRRQQHPPQHVRHHQTRSQVSFHVLWSAHYPTHKHTDVGWSCQRAAVSLNGGAGGAVFFLLPWWLKRCNNW